MVTAATAVLQRILLIMYGCQALADDRTLSVVMQNEKLVEKIKVLADKKGCKPGQLALAWVQQQGDDVFPIPGTKSIRYLEENIAAFNVKLSKQEMTELEEAVPHSAVSHLFEV